MDPFNDLVNEGPPPKQSAFERAASWRPNKRDSKQTTRAIGLEDMLEVLSVRYPGRAYRLRRDLRWLRKQAAKRGYVVIDL